MYPSPLSHSLTYPLSFSLHYFHLFHLLKSSSAQRLSVLFQFQNLALSLPIYMQFLFLSFSTCSPLSLFCNSLDDLFPSPDPRSLFKSLSTRSITFSWRACAILWQAVFLLIDIKESILDIKK